MALVSDAEWLLENSEILDRGLAGWLFRLAVVDAAFGWEIDGQSSCVEWLMHRAKMARSTAFERVQIARALRHRPALSDAFREGRISYSAARVMARMMDPGSGSRPWAVVEARLTRTVRNARETE